jgi:hypothetical protein
LSAIRQAQRTVKRNLDSHGKHIMFRRDDVPNMTDALSYGSEVPHRLGFVEMYANPKGREKVNDLFPETYIDWKPLPSGCPDQWAGWKTFEINLPEVIKAIPTNLPMDLTKAEGSGPPQTPDASACRVAIGSHAARCRTGPVPRHGFVDAARPHRPPRLRLHGDATQARLRPHHCLRRGRRGGCLNRCVTRIRALED